MIQYNKLELKDNYLDLDVQVEDLPYFENIMIEGARIDTIDTFGKGPNTEYAKIDESEQTRLISRVNLPKNNELYLITPNIIGEPSIETPCNKDINKIGIVYDKSYINSKGLQYLKELSSTCSIPKGFIDFILKVKALDLAINSCNPTLAIKYWELLNKKINTAKTNCGCYGSN